MAINMNTLRTALGDKFDSAGDYVVCGYNDCAMMISKGYTEVGKIQDSSPANSELLVYDRRSAPKPEPKVRARPFPKPVTEPIQEDRPKVAEPIKEDRPKVWVKNLIKKGAK